MVSKNKLQSLSLVTALCNGKDGVFVVDKYCISRVQIKTAPSIEGAVSKLAVARRSWPMRPGRQPLRGLAQHRNRNLRVDVGVQMQLDREVANGLQRTGGHNDFGFLHIKALLGERFGDIRIGDRAK